MPENVERLNPEVELTGEDAVEFEANDDISAQADYPNTGYGATDSYTTVDSAADVGVFNKLAFRRGTVVVKNTGANSATVEILGSVDKGKTFDVPLVTAGGVAVAGGAVVSANVPSDGHFSHLKVRARSSVAATPTTVVAKGAFAD